jgi:hypothetical protein
MELLEKLELIEEKLDIIQNKNLKTRHQNHFGCEKICSDNMENRTKWKHYIERSPHEGFVAQIDISHCQFIKTPAIFTSLGGQKSSFLPVLFQLGIPPKDLKMLCRVCPWYLKL